MSRADHDPDQAEAQMSRFNRQAELAEGRRDDAQELVDALEQEMDAAGDPDTIETLQNRHQQAEQSLSDAESDLQSVLGQLGDAQTFWFED
jgi:predicted  nucleic acid-binding Zn-ribbon protein